MSTSNATSNLPKFRLFDLIRPQRILPAPSVKAQLMSGTQLECVPESAWPSVPALPQELPSPPAPSLIWMP